MDIMDLQDSSQNSSYLSPGEVLAVSLTMGIGGIIATVVCIVALGWVLKLKLYKYFIHRLAIYQVIAALLFAIVCIIEMIVGLTHQEKVSCIIVGFLLQYTIWLKLMFTFCLTFHLFRFAVWYKTVHDQKLEVAYVLLSFLFPLLFNWIPFKDDAYGPAGPWCWIRNWNDKDPTDSFKLGEIEEFTLLYGPALVGLTIASVAVIIVIVVLICRVKKQYYTVGDDKRQGEQESLLQNNRDQRKRILKETLPLVTYPILSALFYIPAFTNRVIGSVDSIPKVNANLFVSFMWSAISLPSLGLFAGLTLIIHVAFLRRKTNEQDRERDNRRTFSTNTLTTATVPSTRWVPIPESVIDEEIMTASTNLMTVSAGTATTINNTGTNN